MSLHIPIDSFSVLPEKHLRRVGMFKFVHRLTKILTLPNKRARQYLFIYVSTELVTQRNGLIHTSHE